MMRCHLFQKNKEDKITAKMLLILIKSVDKNFIFNLSQLICFKITIISNYRKIL